jgi:hypothetical protein
MIAVAIVEYSGHVVILKTIVAEGLLATVMGQDQLNRRDQNDGLA